VFNDSRRGEVETYSSVEDAKKNLLERAAAEDTRYKEIYGIEYFNLNNYNLVLDSTYTKPEMLAEVILNEKKEYEEKLRLNGNPEPRILLSPSRLLGAAGNTRDNESIYNSDAVVSLKNGELEIVSGKDGIEKAVRDGYEFVSVKYV